jgi:poly(3-hydroxybutyrate) depolymerase/prenyltransferase beta subunit
MKRFLTGLAACLVVATPAARAHAQTPSELQQTARYAAAFQNPDGGFAAAPGGTSALGPTSSAVRILKYTGGSIPDVLACIKYVKSCFNPEAGGFAQTPGGKPDVSTTASGLMALTELKIADSATVDKAVKFLATNAKTFEEIRIAVAGFEAVKRPTPDVAAWEALVKQNRNTDGTFGQGDAMARETGGRAVALLRMGVDLDRKNDIIAALKRAQRTEGAWARDEKGAELDSSYRIMRFFFMSKAKPDLDRLRAFIARCRHSDGGYGLQPGAPETLGATYFASIILYWSRILDGEPAIVETAGFQPVFNGKDLTGWEGDTSLWSARNNMLVGSSSGLKHNDFLATNGSWNSFVLKLTFQLVNGEGNSGVQFRSVRVPGHEMSGYQADIGQNYWGCLYDESRRNRVLVQASDAALKALHKDGWNHYVLDAKGPNIRLALNGTNSVTYQEKDPQIARDGRFAVQMHAGGPMEVRFKDIYIQPIPEPAEDSSATPGFHLRALKAGDGGRKYTLYLPKGYDGQKTFPVILFLHGAGERGDDGVKSAQVGLGPAVLNNPEAFPAIVIFPQAKTTWAAGSDDAKAALAALDEVLKEFKGDPKRVVLTGLSMGGRGSWENAAAAPDRFAAVVPICGPGRTESAKTLTGLPVWAFVGDADRDPTVLNLRAMVEAIRAEGGKARHTEYRGVGHNSWDRAYSDATLAEWMLAQARR